MKNLICRGYAKLATGIPNFQHEYMFKVNTQSLVEIGWSYATLFDGDDWPVVTNICSNIVMWRNLVQERTARSSLTPSSAGWIKNHGSGRNDMETPNAK